MSDHPLSPIPAADAALAYATLVSAYSDDPVYRWLYPDDSSYPDSFPLLVAALADGTFETSTAWQCEGDRAVALWVPPGVRPDAERIGRVLVETVPAEKHPDVFATLEITDAARPQQPHWYLSWLGVETSEQGKGLGSRLLVACLDYIDIGGLAAYLLATSPRNVAFFERYGFVVQKRVQQGEAPAFTVMVRAGRHS
jgi:ribosomal protein S18 acetylase RimI-like enzyme